MKKKWNNPNLAQLSIEMTQAGNIATKASPLVAFSANRDGRNIGTAIIWYCKCCGITSIDLVNNGKLQGNGIYSTESEAQAAGEAVHSPCTSEGCSA